MQSISYYDIVYTIIQMSVATELISHSHALVCYIDEEVLNLRLLDTVLHFTCIQCLPSHNATVLKTARVMSLLDLQQLETVASVKMENPTTMVAIAWNVLVRLTH